MLPLGWGFGGLGCGVGSDGGKEGLCGVFAELSKMLVRSRKNAHLWRMTAPPGSDPRSPAAGACSLKKCCERGTFGFTRIQHYHA